MLFVIKSKMRFILIALLSFSPLTTVMGQTNDFAEYMKNPKNFTVESYLKLARNMAGKLFRKKACFFMVS